MTTYSALAQQQIAAANLNLKPYDRRRLERNKVQAERIHALAFGVFESAGLGIMSLNEPDIVDAVYSQVKLTGFAGWMLNTLILQVVTKLVAAAWTWLLQRIDEWREKQRVVSGAPHMASLGLRSELEPLFADARKVAAA